MSDLKVAKGDPVRAEGWNALVDRVELSTQGAAASLASMPAFRVQVNNTSGRDFELGEVFYVDGYDGPTDRYNIAGDFELDVITPVWHTKIATPLVAAEPIPDGERGLAVLSGLCILSVDSSSTGTHAMIDPANPEKCKLASGGFAAVLSRIDTSLALVILGQTQNRWLYKRTENSQAPATSECNLYTIDGTLFATTINLSDPRSVGSQEQTDFQGYCHQVGNEFHIAAGPCP